jgi:single-strand DNA-binding protein
MNKFIGIGRITHDIELRYTSSNLSVIQFSIAINTGYGENVRTDYIECVAWRKLAENIHKYCSKGSLISVEGRLQNSNYTDKDGNKRYATKVIVENAMFLDKKKENSAESVENTAESQQDTAEQKDPFEAFGEEIELSDDDIPWIN